MKKLRVALIVLLAVYLANALLLRAFFFDYVLVNNFKLFFGVFAIENTDLLSRDAWRWIGLLVDGLINIGLMVGLVMLLVNKANKPSPDPGTWGLTHPTQPTEHIPPPPAS